MADESNTTQAILRALLKEMEKSLAAPKPKEPDLDNYKTRMDTKEFLRGQQQEENWWSEGEGGGEDAFIGLRPRPRPSTKPRGKRRLR